MSPYTDKVKDRKVIRTICLMACTHVHFLDDIWPLVLEQLGLWASKLDYHICSTGSTNVRHVKQFVSFEIQCLE